MIIVLTIGTLIFITYLMYFFFQKKSMQKHIENIIEVKGHSQNTKNDFDELNNAYYLDSDNPFNLVQSKPIVNVTNFENVIIDKNNEQTCSLEKKNINLKLKENDKLDDSRKVNHPIFHFLTVRNIQKHSTPTFLYPNARIPQVFSSPFSKGHLLIMLMVTSNPDPYYQAFFDGKRRKFELQLQITLKETPRGIIYIGGMVPFKMQLGILTKSLSHTMLSILNKLSPILQSSFGKNFDDPSQVELPHISFPLWSEADRLVITKPNQKPPVIGQEIEESSLSHKKRRKQKVNLPGEVKAGDTITFSIRSMYLDIVEWKICNLPFMKDFDLNVFWNNMPLQLSIYDLKGFELKMHKAHIEFNKRNYMSFQIENTLYQCDSSVACIVSYPEIHMTSASPTESSNLLNEKTSRYITSDIQDQTTDEKPLVQDSVKLKINEKNSKLCCNNLYIIACFQHFCIATNKIIISFVLKQHDTRVFSLQKYSSFFVPCFKPLLGKNSNLLPKLEPCNIWEWENIRSILNNTLYLNKLKTLPLEWLNTEQAIVKKCTYNNLNIRISNKILKDGNIEFECPILFCLWESWWVEKWLVIIKHAKESRKESSLLFFNPNSTTPSITITFSELLHTEELGIEHVPFSSSFPALEIETIARVILIGFSSQNLRAVFQKKISFLMSSAQRYSKKPSFNFEIINLTQNFEVNRWGSRKMTVLNARRVVFESEHSHSLVCNATDFSCEDNTCPEGSTYSENGSLEHERTVLKNGKVNSCSKYSANFESSVSKSYHTQPIFDQHDCTRTPWEVSAKLLRYVLDLNETSSMEKLINFFNIVTIFLRRLDIIKWSCTMTEEQRICFALNLYHVLRLHAKLTIGQPSSVFGWWQFSSKVCYAIGSGSKCIYLTLSNIEHGILRASLPTRFNWIPFLSPYTKFTKLLELNSSEPRINFCINYGTISCPTNIIILDSPEIVHKALNIASSYFIDEVVFMNQEYSTIYIPKLCLWFAHDFLGKGTAMNAKKVSKKILRYARPEICEIFKEFLIDDSNDSKFSFKVKPFSWKVHRIQGELISA